MQSMSAFVKLKYGYTLVASRPAAGAVVVSTQSCRCQHNSHDVVKQCHVTTGKHSLTRHARAMQHAAWDPALL